MKRILEFFLALFLRFILWFRYRLVFKGLEKLNPETLNKPGGILFLPNHPSVFVDPVAAMLAVTKKYPIRPMVIEYMYYMPVAHAVLKFLDALPVPDFSVSSNSLKRKKNERIMQAVIDGLKHRENFLIYPAGRVKLTQKEIIGGTSGAHRILQEVPETNVVLVRVKGLWGSSFSSYQGGKGRALFETIWQGVKVCLKNLIFFTPRREVIIEMEPAPLDFPWQGTRSELNRYLENWYNQPDGLTPQEGKYPGDSLVLVSYSMWGEKYLEPPETTSGEESTVDLSSIPESVKEKTLQKIAELSDRDPSKIMPEQDLAIDLGLDSLDIAELSAFLQDHFDLRTVPGAELTTVSKVLGIASRQIIYQEEAEPDKDISKWKATGPKVPLEIAAGKTVAEVFLNNSERMGKAVACGDMRAGVLTYQQIRMRSILLAEYIRKLPGEYVGILLPASVAVNLVILATEIAGKIPLMINWTVGSRHIESVIQLSNVQAVISSWEFLDRLDNVELAGLEDKLMMLEDIRREISLWQKAKAAWRTRRSTKALLRIFNLSRQKETDPAVLLFTSGTESMPKGVPLSHKNLLSNLNDIFSIVEVYSDDVLLGILPPFHAFGFSISSLFGFLTGLRVASSPNPTDGKRLAHGIEKWGATILCGAPTFLKGIFKVATPEQLTTLRLCVTGAEKAPPELFERMSDLGKREILIEGYGITECSPVLTVNPVIGEHRGVGQPLPTVELCIIHPETFEVLPTGAQGLVLACGPNIFSGYLNKDVASPFVEIEGKKWYKTGDLGFLDAEGYLMLSGRQKRFIKIGGEMVSLTALEDAILTDFLKEGTSKTEEGPILAISAQEILGDKPKIFLFTRYATTVDAINAVLKEAGFSNLVRISSVIQLNEIPLMGSGKVNYRALESKYINK